MSDRGTWDKKIEYILSSVGFAVGLGNVWRFPYLAYKNGGGAFLLPYIIVLFLCGMPLFLLEASLGQFSSQGPVRAFNGMPLVKGLGFSMLCISFYIAVYYNVILSWTLYYLYESVLGFFNNYLPWQECPDNTPRCFTREQVKNCSSTTCEFYDTRQMPVQVFWNRAIGDPVEPSSSKSEIDVFPLGGLHSPLVITLFIAWLIIGLSIVKGVKSSGKTMYVTATVPYIILAILFARGILLPGASEGVMFFIKPDFKILKSINIWKDAVAQIFFSLGSGWGCLLTLSSYNNFRNNIYRDTYFVVLTNSFTSIFAGFAIFSYLGYMANSLQLDITEVVDKGPGLAFQVWPEAMTKLSESPKISATFAIMFFLMLFSLGLSTMVVTVENIITSFFDLFPKKREKRSLVLLVLVIILFTLGLPMVTKNGFYLFTLVDNYAAVYSVILIAIVELVSVSYIYKIKRLNSDFLMMTGKMLPKFFALSWKYVCPVLLTVMLGMLCFDHDRTYFEFYGKKFYLEDSTNIIALILVLLPIVIFSVVLAREVLKSKNFTTTLKPTRHWGPLSDEDRKSFNSERTDGIFYKMHTEISASNSTESVLKSSEHLITKSVPYCL